MEVLIVFFLTLVLHVTEYSALLMRTEYTVVEEMKLKRLPGSLKFCFWLSSLIIHQEIKTVAGAPLILKSWFIFKKLVWSLS